MQGTGLDIEGQLPTATRFIGREQEMAILRRHFYQKSNQSPNIALIQGDPGIGKTQTAIQYALKSRTQYDLVYKVSGSSHEAFMSSLVQFYERLSPEMLHGDDDSNIDALSTELRATDRRFLIIFDDCVEGIFDSLRRFLDRFERGHFIVTTADDGFAERMIANFGANSETLATFHSLQLVALPYTRTVRLLTNSMRVDKKAKARRACEPLLDMLQGNPLLIDLVGSYLAYDAQSVHRPSLFAALNLLKKSGLATSPEAVLSTIAGESMRLLEPESAALFGILCQLDTDHIQASLFFPPSGLPWTELPVGRPSISVDSPPFQDKPRFYQIMNNLLQLGLVQPIPRSSEPSYTINRTLARVARSQMMVVDSNNRALENAIRIVSSWLPEVQHPLTTWQDWERGDNVGSHVNACWALAKSVVACQPALQEMLLKAASMQYIWRGGLDRSIAILRNVLGDVHSNPESRTDDEIKHMVLYANLIIWYTTSDKIYREEGFSFIRMVLQECRKRFGEQNPLTIEIKRICGRAESHFDLQSCTTTLQESYDACCCLYGPKDRRTMLAYATLAAVKLESLDPSTARSGEEMLSIMEEHLRDSEEDAGRNDTPTHLFGTLAIYMAMSRGHEARNDFARMEHYERKVLTLYRAETKGSHVFIAGRVFDILRAMNKRGQWDEMAQFLHEQPECQAFKPKFIKFWPKTFKRLSTDLSDLSPSRKAIDIVSFVDHFAERWFASSMEPGSIQTLGDMRYNIAVSCDIGDYKTAVDKILEYLSYSKTVLRSSWEVRYSNHVELVMDIAADILLKAAHKDISVFNYDDGVENIGFDVLRSSPLNSEYVDLFNRLWDGIQRLQCGLDIDFRQRFLDERNGLHESLTAFLQLAVSLGNLELTNLILARGPDINLANPNGRNAMYFAAKFQHYDVFRRLLEASPTRPTLSFKDKTILHVLCTRRSTDMDSVSESKRLQAVAAAIRHGCPIEKKDLMGNTALDLARKYHFASIAEILSNSGVIVSLRLRLKEQEDIISNHGSQLPIENRVDLAESQKTEMSWSEVPTQAAIQTKEDADLASAASKSLGPESSSPVGWPDGVTVEAVDCLHNSILQEYREQPDVADLIIRALQTQPPWLLRAVYYNPQEHANGDQPPPLACDEGGDNSRQGRSANNSDASERPRKRARGYSYNNNDTNRSGSGDEGGEEEEENLRRHPSKGDVDRRQTYALLCPFRVYNSTGYRSRACKSGSFKGTTRLK